EDGIRDKLVTGVQTCALPILHEPEIDSAAVHVEIKLLALRDRPISLGHNPRRRVLLEASVERHALAPVLDVAVEIVVMNLSEAQIGRASCRERVMNGVVGVYL